MKFLKNNKNLKVIIDDKNYEYLNQFSWYVLVKGVHSYIGRSVCTLGKVTRVYLHREIMNAPKGMLVDHINGNTLDNRKENLRICEKKENCRNHKKRNGGKTKYIGVSTQNSKINPFTAGIMVDYKRIHLGVYPTEELAAKAYDKAAMKYFGEFARLNFKEQLGKSETKES